MAQVGRTRFPGGARGPNDTRINMSPALKARLYASTTAITLGGLILAMGAPVKWCIVFW